MVQIGESVRGKNVYIVQSTCNPVSSTLMELLIAIDACKRASANFITAVIPYYGYARQDRKTSGREAITAKLVADLLTTAGTTRVLAMDLHTGQIQGFFNILVDHIFANPILVDYFKSLNIDPDEMVCVSPDMGGANRTRHFAKKLDCPIAIIDKRRPKPNSAEVMNLIGDINGKNCVIIDDMVDTAGTLTKAANMLMEKGALSVRALATHAVLSGAAYENIANSQLAELIVTDTIPLRPAPGADTSKIKVISIAELIGDVIDKVYNYKPISTSFIF